MMKSKRIQKSRGKRETQSRAVRERTGRLNRCSKTAEKGRAGVLIHEVNKGGWTDEGNEIQLKPIRTQMTNKIKQEVTNKCRG